MDNKQFKQGQEVWTKAIVVNNEPDFQGYTHLKSKNDWQFRVKTEDIATEIPEKPIVPQFVADYIKYAKTTFRSLKGTIYFDEIYTHNYANWSRDKVKLIAWMSIEENQEVFAKAWLFGYEVEQEKLYTVKLKANDQILSKHYGTIGFVHSSIALSQSYIQFSKSELEQAGFGWVFDCDGVKVVEE